MVTNTTSSPAFVERLFYSPEQFAVGLGVSRATTYRMMSDGEIKSTKFKGSRKIPHAEYARLAEGAS